MDILLNKLELVITSKSTNNKLFKLSGLDVLVIVNCALLISAILFGSILGKITSLGILKILGF